MVLSTLNLPGQGNLPLLPQTGAAHHHRHHHHGHHHHGHHHGHGGHHHHHGPSVVIVSPTNNSQSPRFAQLTGRISDRGDAWPVVLIHPQLQGELWYVQPQVVTVQKDGTFTTPIFVGNLHTPPGLRFDIEVILAKSKQAAAKLFPVETTLKSLPSDLVKSGPVVVAREVPPSSSAVTILTPTNNSQSPRFAQLTGRVLTQDGSWPVVLVHPLVDGEPWYVQPQVVTVQKDGTFTTPITVGSAQTPPGTRFEIVVVLAKSKQDAQNLFPVGAMLKSLPRDLPTSAPVVVTQATTPPAVA